MAIETAIGRVVPSYEGDWSSSKSYKKLDNVLRNGSTYIAIQENTNQTPEDHPNFWQLIAQKGEQGIQGEQGPQGEQGIQGKQGIKGDKGDSGSGSVSMVDGVLPGDASTGFNVPLTAVQFGRAQDSAFYINNFGIASSQVEEVMTQYQAQARANINAQIADNYIVSPPSRVVGQFLKFSNQNTWVTEAINTVPSGGSSGQFLKKTSNSTIWDDVHEVIPGGSAGAVLTKVDATNYKLTWSNPISNPEIDALFE